MSYCHPTRLAGVVAALMLSLGSASTVAESTLTYGGDSQSNSYQSITNVLLYPGWINQIVFDNFSVAAGAQWAVSGVFGQGTVLVDPEITNLNWEIRQAMVVDGSTGTVVASGSAPYTYIETNIDPALLDYRFTIATPGLTLGSGEYWLGIWGDMSTAVNFNVGISQTAGANSVNALGDRSGVWLVGADAANVGGSAQAIATDLSYGLMGTVVPEPASGLLLTLGLCGLVATRRLRRA